MGEAVIVSAIEKLGNFLLKKADLQDDEKEKLSSLVVEKADLRSVVVGMAELLEDNKEMLYRLLVKVASPFNLEEDEEEETVMNDEEERRRRKREVNAEKVSSLAFEMADLWEDDDKESIYKDKLHTVLLHMKVNYHWNKNKEEGVYEKGFYEKLYSLAIEMAEDEKGKLSKEKLYSWLAKKADLWDFQLLHHLTTLPRRDLKRFRMKDVLKKVEEAKNDLMIILDIINKSEDLRYFISDAVEMAYYASLLITVMDSDPFIFCLEIYNCFFIDGFPLIHAFGEFLEEIASIQKWIQETKERMMEFGSADESQINYVGEELQLVDVVGLEEDVEFILRRLIENDDTITCIKGMGCIGKTTLARVVYNHPKIVDRFEGRAWVCDSSWKSSRKELLINLIRQLHSKEFQKDDDVDDMLMKLEEADNRSLRQMLHQQLRFKRFFIVLDDVSEDTYLKYLIYRDAIFRPADTHKGSKLLLTTRDKDIIWKYGAKKHEMKNLDDEKSWQLLLKTALYGSSDDEKFPKQLERRGRQMLRKCAGLPLAIKEMGRQWAEKRQSGSEWEQIVESSMDLDLSETLAALESTYLKLDPKAKSCFFRLAFFKEGTPIRANKLLQILTASGGQNIGMWSLDELEDESIIEVKEMNKFHYPDGAKTYRINDVFHMLSIRKAEDEIGFEIRKKDGNNRASHEPHNHRVTHHRRHDKFNFNYSMNQDKHLLSLFFYGGGFSDISTPSYWNHFGQLKILDMEGFGLKILPETVGELTELLYLGLRNNCIQELPRSLGRLKKLEVLDIALNFMVAVPDIIWEMDSLQHLYMSDIICQKPLKIDALRNLQTLTYISVDNWKYKLSGLKKMRAIRKLGIEGVDENTNVSKLFASLAQLHTRSDYSLILKGFRFKSLPSLDSLGILHNVNNLKLEGRLTRLPTANNFPPKLRYLSLVNSCLDEDPMPILEKLPELRWLHLQNAYTGQQMVISPCGFGELYELVIEELWHLRNLQVGQHALKHLRRLEINSCPYLDTLPEGIYPTYFEPELKIVTTINIATKIRESGFISRLKKVDIQP